MENKQNSVSERISSLPYAARLSVWFLIFSVVVMFSSFIFSWMVQPAIYFTIFSIGAVFGLSVLEEGSEVNDPSHIQVIKKFIRNFLPVALLIPFISLFFADLRGFADDLVFLIGGAVFGPYLLKKHLERNFDDELVKKDEDDGFKYVEETPKRLIDWKKIRRIAIVAVLIFTPIYLFADYQRHQIEIMLKSKTSN